MVIDAGGEKSGVITITAALLLAEEQGLDLVEVAPQLRPPVCKILNYGKFKFQAVKQRSDARKKQRATQLKEVKVRPNTDTGDYEVKLRNLKRFLSEGARVKVTLRFKGREAKFQKFGVAMLERVKTDIVDLANIDSDIKTEGRQLSLVCSPKGNKVSS